MEMLFNEINDAYCHIVEAFKEFLAIGNNNNFYLKRSTSRNGDVIRFKEPVTVQYRCPGERVLLSPDRNENPFFHIYEALWMLNGNDDVGSLACLNSNMANYSDNGQTFNGAYGKRWRYAISKEEGVTVDQLYLLIEHLKAQPDSRRAVLQMWNVQEDLLKIEGKRITDQRDICKEFSKDVCCNTACYFDLDDNVLNMSITNRSNDAIWGLLGANYVHFSFLQEYVAAKLGVALGTMTVFSNNVHTYVDKFNENWDTTYLETFNYTPAYLYENLIEYKIKFHQNLTLANKCFYADQGSLSIVAFDKELPKFVKSFNLSSLITLDKENFLIETTYEHGFLEYVAKPALLAFYFHKINNFTESAKYAINISHKEWKRSVIRWLLSRWVAKGNEDCLEGLVILRKSNVCYELEQDLKLL